MTLDKGKVARQQQVGRQAGVRRSKAVRTGNYNRKGGQMGYKGHVLNLPQDIQGFLSRLPPNVAQLPYLIIRKPGADKTHRDCRVRRQKILEAIT